MKDFKIHDGDLLTIDKVLEPEIGNIGIAKFNGFFTVKKVGSGVLLSGNNTFPPIRINPETGMLVWGVVVRVIHDLRQRQRKSRGKL